MGALLVIDVQLALVVFITLPPLVIGTFFFRRASVKAYELARERVSAVNADLQESVSGLLILQAFRRERSGGQRFAEGSDSYRRARTRGQWLISISFPFVQLLSSVASAAVLIVGAHRVDAGTLTTGALVAYLLYIDLFFAPVQQLSQVFDGYQQATVSLGRIQELLQEPTSTKAADEPLDVLSLRGDIAFEDVDFAYGDDEEALSAVSLSIPAGQTVAFVGETGAGKSTLVKLVARFLRPDGRAGDGRRTDLRSLLDLTSYRHRLGVVPQEAYLFQGTVRDAIAYGRPDATDAEVEAAARAVGAHDMIATLDGGYLHEVAERGRTLRRPAPADRVGPRRTRGPGRAAPRRGDGGAGPGDGGPGQPGHRPPRRPPYDPRRRPPSDDGRPRRPGRGHGPRPRRRGRHRRPTPPTGRPLRGVVEDVRRSPGGGGAGSLIWAPAPAPV